MRKNLEKYMDRPDTKVIMLTLTNHCNLNCLYCYEHNKEVREMSLETAIGIIDKEMTMKDGSNFVAIYYFGGEPYLEFEKIKQIHKYLKSHKWNKKWFAFTTTNGTLVHNEIQDWLLENNDSIEVYLSIDGTREMHNHNRSNSYDLIDKDFFVKHFPFAKMTLTEKTLHNLAEGAIDLHKKGFEVSTNIGHGVKWKEDSPEVFSEQLNILMDYYLDNLEIKPANILNLSLMDIEPGTSKPRYFCGVGPMMRSYDIDGIDYPCHAFAPLCIGEKLAAKSRELDFQCPLKMIELDEKCRNCPIVGNCPTCYGINFGAFENVYHVPDDHCKMMKVQFLANAYFKYQLYLRGRLEFTKEEELRFLTNIKAIQSLAD